MARKGIRITRGGVKFRDIELVDKNILKEIEEKARFIDNLNPEERIYHFLKEEAQYHSARIEYPTIKEFLEYLNHQKPKKSRIRKIKKNLMRALSFGLNNFDYKVDEVFVKKIGAKIEPSKKDKDTKLLEFRKSGVKIDFYTPPYPGKLEKELEKYFRDVNLLLELCNMEKVNPCEVAAFAHFHFVRIHPFEDGNGRTARTLQNIILLSYGYPPAVIKEGERIFYSKLVEDAIKGRRERGATLEANDIYQISREEKRFYNYIASKVNESFDAIIESTENFKNFEKE